MEYSYIIIDSDAISNLQLTTFLEEYGEFDCLDVAKSTSEGLNAILKYSPDIVFLNLNDQAPSLFQMVMELHQYLNNFPCIIGLAKSKEYAYDAIKNNFFDYWLQPYSEFEIRKTLNKLKKLVQKEQKPQTICLKSYKDFHYINTNDILYLQADNNTTEFYLKDGSVTNAFKTLKTFEKQLPQNFLRIHQSYIVNINYVSRINFGKSICCLNTYNTKLPFSKSYRENMDALKKKLSKNSISTLN